MDRNPYAAPATALEKPTSGTVSMVWYGFLCFLGLLVTLAGGVLMSRIAGAAAQWTLALLGLLASVQFAHGRFVHTHHRRMSRLELQRFALACAAAFWVSDEGTALVRRFLTPDNDPLRVVFTVLIATIVDVALAAAMVYATVPWMARYFLRQRPPAAGDSPHDGERDSQTH